MAEGDEGSRPDDALPLPQPRAKLLAVKEQWAREGRLLTGQTAQPEEQRLPPGQKLVQEWPVLDLGVQPEIRLEKFRLRVEGMVQAPLRLTWEEFQALPQQQAVNDIHCVTQWSRFDNHWQGVSAQHLLDLARPRGQARFVTFHSYDGYTTNVPLEEFAQADVLLAHSWEGKPLTRQHGGPVRVVIPRLYLWKSAKWITRIELHATDRPGFWEERGYHNHGDPWLEERYG